MFYTLRCRCDRKPAEHFPLNSVRRSPFYMGQPCFLPEKDLFGETFITVVSWDLTAGTETLNDRETINATFIKNSSPFSKKAVTMRIIVQVHWFLRWFPFVAVAVVLLLVVVVVIIVVDIIVCGVTIVVIAVVDG